MTESEAMLVQKQKDITKLRNILSEYPALTNAFVNRIIKAVEE